MHGIGDLGIASNGTAEEEHPDGANDDGFELVLNQMLDPNPTHPLTGRPDSLMKRMNH